MILSVFSSVLMIMQRNGGFYHSVTSLPPQPPQPEENRAKALEHKAIIEVSGCGKIGVAIDHFIGWNFGILDMLSCIKSIHLKVLLCYQGNYCAHAIVLANAPQVHTICSSCSTHCTAVLKPVESQLACVHYFQIIDVQMEQSVVKGVSFMETYKRANVSAIIHEASTSISTTSLMVSTIVHRIKSPSILL